MLVRTGMYHFEVSRTALYRVRYELARTSTYHLVLYQVYRIPDDSMYIMIGEDGIYMEYT
jgi:hypothetical protein